MSLRRLVFLLAYLVWAPLIHAITVNVAWDYGDSGQDGFQLLRCTGVGAADCTPSVALGFSIGPTARQAADTTVAAGSHYCYTVLAILTGNPSSSPSNVLCLTVPTPGVATQLAYTTPPQPSTLTNQAMNTIAVAVRDAFEMTVTGSSASITVALETPAETVIPQSQLILVSVDSQETICETAPGAYAIDALTTTHWHTAYCTTVAALPHTLIVDLGMTYNVTGLRYLPRQDIAPTTASGTIANYQFSVSPDGTNWGTVAASGTFANTVAEKTVTFAGRSGRYVRLVATSEVHGDQWTSVAKLTVLQTPTGGGTLQGVTTGNASGGTLAFPGLSVNQAGSYTLLATSGGLTSTSAPFTIVDPTTPTQVPYVVRLGH